MAATSRPGPDLWALARRQHGVVTLAQLRDAGLTRSGIRHRARTRRLWMVSREVFAVGRAELTREGRWMAAVLACGDGAALSHLSAAALWEIRERRSPNRSQVSVPTHAGRRAPPGVELHRAATLRANDITERNAIAVTTLRRTLIDLATILDDRQLKSALRQCERVHRLDLAQLLGRLEDLPQSSPGPARLRRLLDVYVPAHTESDLEAAFLELCGKHGLPMPETQVEVGPYRVDFLWREQKLVVETDGRAAHDGFVAFREDRVRDRAMKTAGFEVLRFAEAEVRREAEVVARDVLATLARRSTLPR